MKLRFADRTEAMLEDDGMEIPSKYAKFLPENFWLSGVAIREEHGWTAIALDFDIAAPGDTSAEAVRQVIRLVNDYLIVCFDEGMSFDDSVRPAPARFWEMYKNEIRGDVAGFEEFGPDPTVLEIISYPPSSYFRQPLSVV